MDKLYPNRAASKNNNNKPTKNRVLFHFLALSQLLWMSPLMESFSANTDDQGSPNKDLAMGTCPNSSPMSRTQQIFCRCALIPTPSQSCRENGSPTPLQTVGRPPAGASWKRQQFPSWASVHCTQRVTEKMIQDPHAFASRSLAVPKGLCPQIGLGMSEVSM